VIIAVEQMVAQDLKTLTVLRVLITLIVMVLVHVSVKVYGLASDVLSGLDSVLRTVLDVQVH
jgi:uncharacterized membrane protein